MIEDSAEIRILDHHVVYLEAAQEHGGQRGSIYGISEMPCG